MEEISKKLKTKSEIIAEVAEKHCLPLSTATLFIDTVFDEITQTLLQNGKVELRGFGTFGVKKYKAYKGRNPKNQQRVMVRAKKRPWFKAGQIKDALNKKSS